MFLFNLFLFFIVSQVVGYSNIIVSQIEQSKYKQSDKTKKVSFNVTDVELMNWFYQTDKIRDIRQFIDKDTILLLDIDNTIFESKQALAHDHWFVEELKLREKTAIDIEVLHSELCSEWNEYQKICEVKSLESGSIEFFRELQKEGVTIVGLTHRNLLFCDATLSQLKSVGFDFNTSLLKVKYCEIKTKTKYPAAYKEGIIFVNERNDKGATLIDFLSQNNIKAKKIVFVDDRCHNVNSLFNVFKNTNVEYKGIWYTAVDNNKVYRRDIADIQKRLFGNILSNEAAEALIEKGF